MLRTFAPNTHATVDKPTAIVGIQAGAANLTISFLLNLTPGSSCSFIIFQAFIVSFAEITAVATTPIAPTQVNMVDELRIKNLFELFIKFDIILYPLCLFLRISFDWSLYIRIDSVALLHDSPNV